MPRPSNASIQVPSERVFQSPLDFPNSLVCILDDAVSKGCKVKFRNLNIVRTKISYSMPYFIKKIQKELNAGFRVNLLLIA